MYLAGVKVGSEKSSGIVPFSVEFSPCVPIYRYKFRAMCQAIIGQCPGASASAVLASPSGGRHTMASPKPPGCYLADNIGVTIHHRGPLQCPTIVLPSLYS